MSENVRKKQFNMRAFISTGLFVSGILLPFSGLMNHYLQFEGLTLARHFWMSVHDISGILFAIFAILHIIKNWKSLVAYVKKSKDIIISKESMMAVIIVLAIVALIASHPFHIKG